MGVTEAVPLAGSREGRPHAAVKFALMQGHRRGSLTRSLTHCGGRLPWFTFPTVSSLSIWIGFSWGCLMGVSGTWVSSRFFQYSGFVLTDREAPSCKSSTSNSSCQPSAWCT